MPPDNVRLTDWHKWRVVAAKLPGEIRGTLWAADFKSEGDPKGISGWSESRMGGRQRTAAQKRHIDICCSEGTIYYAATKGNEGG